MQAIYLKRTGLTLASECLREVDLSIALMSKLIKTHYKLLRTVNVTDYFKIHSSKK